MSDQKPEINIVPLEHKNRFTSQAFQAWGESETNRALNVILGVPEWGKSHIAQYNRAKNDFIDRFVRAKEDMYMQRERDKNAFNEMQTAMTTDLEEIKAQLVEAKERLVKLQAPK